MSDLRERFQALDALDVPDVMSRARIMGPRPPEPDRAPPMRRVGALVLAAVIAIVAAVLVIRALDDSPRPADPSPTPPAFRQDGEVITYSGSDAYEEGDLVAVDPETGTVRTLVDAETLLVRDFIQGIPVGTRFLTIGSAAWSADGRWVAFEIRGCDDGSTRGDLSPGLWVMNASGESRQLTTRPCSEDPDEELWEWSPAGAQLAVARRSIDGYALVLIDPATGDRTDLGRANGYVTSLAWSPDGSRIAYGAVPGGTADDIYTQGSRGSVYSVGVGGGEHSLLASSVGVVSGGETGSGIRWSPDGARIAVTAEGDENSENRLYLMNADGSDLDLLTEGVVIEHILGSPNVMWSPDGARIAYATSSGDRGGPDVLQVWNGSADGSTPVLVFESAPPSQGLAGGPVWSPDGTRIAFRYSLTEERVSLVANTDGTGDARQIDELRYLSWRGGWYFCECFG